MKTWWMLFREIDIFRKSTLTFAFQEIIVVLFSAVMSHALDTKIFLIVNVILPILYLVYYFKFVRKWWLEELAQVEREEYLGQNFGYYYDRIVNDKEY